MRIFVLGMVVWAGVSLAYGDSIHEAAKAGKLDEVKAILKESPFMRSALDTGGQTPAVIAAGAGHVAVVEYLLSAGVKVDDATPTKKTMLHAACERGKLDVAKVLVLKYRANIKAKDERQLEPIHYAAQSNPIELLQFMIDQRADVNAQSRVGATPLMGAVNKKMKPQVELLLKNRADPNKEGEMKRTALHYAVGNKDLAMVEILVKAGARPTTKNSDGKTALDLAKETGQADIAAVLEKVGGGAKKKPGAK